MRNYLLFLLVAALASCAGRGVEDAKPSEAAAAQPASPAFGEGGLSLCEAVLWADVVALGTVGTVEQLSSGPHLLINVELQEVLKGEAGSKLKLISTALGGADDGHAWKSDAGATHLLFLWGNVNDPGSFYHMRYPCMPSEDVGPSVPQPLPGKLENGGTAAAICGEKMELEAVIKSVSAMVSDYEAECGPISPGTKAMFEGKGKQVPDGPVTGEEFPELEEGGDASGAP